MLSVLPVEKMLNLFKSRRKRERLKNPEKTILILDYHYEIIHVWKEPKDSNESGIAAKLYGWCKQYFKFDTFHHQLCSKVQFLVLVIDRIPIVDRLTFIVAKTAYCIKMRILGFVIPIYKVAPTTYRLRFLFRRTL